MHSVDAIMRLVVLLDNNASSSMTWDIFYLEDYLIMLCAATYKLDGC